MPTETHPSPHRHRVSPAVLLFAITGAGAAWLLQLIVDYGLAAHRCYPDAAPLEVSQVAASGTYPLVMGLNAVAIILAVTAGLVARRIWTLTRDEQVGSTSHLLEAGEGRTRFLAMCGQLAGLGFLIAILFDTVAVYWVPRCFD